MYKAENLFNIENETIQFTIKNQTFMKTLLTALKRKQFLMQLKKQSNKKWKESVAIKEITNIKQNMVNWYKRDHK